MLSSGTLVKGEKGEYLVKDLIATGGMSFVYLGKARDGNNVVLKIPNNQGKSLNKLLFERDLLRNLDHAHLVRYFDSAFINLGVYSYPVLILEHAIGIPIFKKILKEPMDEKEAKVRLIKLLLAVDYLSSRNIVHRDINPRNVLISDDLKYLKLIDFGTATFFNLTGVKEAVISPGGYTPPEQYRYTFSVQGDIWSSAATCFFAITGQNPEIAMPGYPYNKTKPPDPRKFNKDVSEDFAKVLMKAMSWNPVDRFLTAKEMIEAIDKGAIPKEEGPILEVMGVTIKIDAKRVLFGRMSDDAPNTSIAPLSSVTNIPEDRIRVIKEGDTLEVYVYDPYKWISRKHFEIFEEKGEWYFRDLGSLNKSAVLVGDKQTEVWEGYKKESAPFKLGKKAILYLAYGKMGNPPYLTAVFRIN
ncbi:MAG: protein kinase [Archaeoglobaceae archaeon]